MTSSPHSPPSAPPRRAAVTGPRRLARALAARLALPTGVAAARLEIVLDELARALARGADVELRGLGSFRGRRPRRRRVRHIVTGCAIEVRAAPTIAFRAGRVLRRRLTLSGAPTAAEASPVADGAPA